MLLRRGRSLEHLPVGDLLWISEVPTELGGSGSSETASELVCYQDVFQERVERGGAFVKTQQITLILTPASEDEAGLSLQSCCLHLICI